MNNRKQLINERFVKAVNALISDNKEINKKYIAEEIGIGQSALSEILNFRTNISAELISIFCIRFHINPSWILMEEGPIYSHSETIVIEKDMLRMIRRKTKEIDQLLVKFNLDAEEKVQRLSKESIPKKDIAADSAPSYKKRRKK
jgi:transcriptional regulator with XRE-family HTH domain